jgi:hypothetical protein
MDHWEWEMMGNKMPWERQTTPKEEAEDPDRRRMPE